MQVATTTADVSPATGHPVDMTDLESKRLDALIAKIRSGDISNVVMRHLEIDGVLRLDPVLDLANAPRRN